MNGRRFVLLAACLLGCALPLGVEAAGADRFIGSARPVSGKACGPASDVVVSILGRQLTFVATPGPMFRGDLRPDGSFELLTLSQSGADRHMPASPELEGHVSGNQIIGEIASRWCVYHFTAQRS
jgi:hypothetical protein